MSNKYLSYPFTKRHRSVILNNISKRESGLEIGPYDKPWILKETHNVKYFDRFDRDYLIEHANRNRDTENIVVIDYVEDSIDDIDEAFDYVVGIHVYEHIPNPIQFLKVAYSKLNKGGRLFLVIPDSRYTFDLCRPTTSAADYIEAYLNKRIKPSSKSVFESVFWGCGLVRHQDLWEKPALRDTILPRRNYVEAWNRAQKAQKCYVDCHVSITTPSLFEEDLKILHQINLLDFSDIVISNTEFNANDFIVRMTKNDSNVLNISRS